MFFIVSEMHFNFSLKLILLPASAFHLDQSKILSFGKDLTVFKTIKCFYNPGKEALKINSLAKEKISPFPTMFSTLFKSNFNIIISFILQSSNAFNLDWVSRAP